MEVYHRLNIKDMLLIIYVYHPSFALFSENLGEKREISPQSNIKEVDTAPSSQPEEGPSDGERMTAELRDIISQFMQKVQLKMSQDISRLPLNAQTSRTMYEPSSIQVEELKLIVSSMSVSTAEQQMVSTVYLLYACTEYLDFMTLTCIILFESSVIPSFSFACA